MAILDISESQLLSPVLLVTAAVSLTINYSAQ